eukprot:CAMPEP_0114272710 /NCGR_PEP_ID=MMETSP0058-20121206/28637_1 /TAXON_ID=36894 /ORGANISM="Pyramimonas parkeae, CCMP726" /LENGTH=882 /DNA_ID=CAMNT_0001391973 /DNA_START=28 /DNA_END=2676 /DNA_ORIENTATION=-
MAVSNCTPRLEAMSVAARAGFKPRSDFFSGQPVHETRIRKTLHCPSRFHKTRAAFNDFQPSRSLVQTPHSGYHFPPVAGAWGRFFEGWYFRVAIPNGPSFAFMYSIEDPQGNSPLSGVGAQVMGPNDGYLLHHDPSVRSFWASTSDLRLGNCFDPASGLAAAPKQMTSERSFFDNVRTGFQVSATSHTGQLSAERGGAGPGPPSTVDTCKWSYATETVYGWGGNSSQKQLSTAGWLAALPVFEPHWQVLMSKGLSTGWIEWGSQRFEFKDAPSYSEKNWGGAFPLKWFWAQCNSFPLQPTLAITVGGGRRELPMLPGAAENVALIGIHWRDEFIGLTPWDGAIEWEVEPWGSWRVSGSNSKYRAEVVATCQASDGTVLRAPTAQSGLAGMCRDTFNGHLELKIWTKSSARAPGNCTPRLEAMSVAARAGFKPRSDFFSGQPVHETRIRKTLHCPSRFHKTRAAFNDFQPSRSLVQTPHSGYHFPPVAGAWGRFFEGWYFRVAIPNGPSFAFMYSIEDPQGNSPLSGVGAQVMGPNDGYLLHHDPSVRSFWASTSDLRLGNCFDPASGLAAAPKQMTSERSFFDNVRTGFQVSATSHTGQLSAERGGAGPGPPSTVDTCKWSYATETVYGWGGNSSQKQLSTAGWLAALPVFEPHWQVLMSKGLSTGWIEWGSQRFEFKDAPSYSEKNWGGAFPLKWFWAQCNSFPLQPTLAITVGGGRRELPMLPGAAENVALIGIHWRDEFIGLTPWDGAIEWEVEPWGSWRVSGSNSKYRAEVVATCQASDGTVLRAPTAQSGLAGMCRDTFNGHLELKIWTKSSARAPGTLVLAAKSCTAALEVGGGPWWQGWSETAEMSEPLRTILAADLPFEAALDSLPPMLRPPGL